MFALLDILSNSHIINVRAVRVYTVHCVEFLSRYTDEDILLYQW